MSRHLYVNGKNVNLNIQITLHNTFGSTFSEILNWESD